MLKAERTRESGLRRKLVKEELVLANGRMSLPEKPGPGVELDEEALAAFRSR